LSWPHKTEKGLSCEANSNEGSNLDAHDEKSMFANDKKQQESADGNPGARTGGMS
jgi:hypothetical protein